MKRIFDTLFGCGCRRYSWPRTTRNGKPCPAYVVCVDCGKEYSYSLSTMRRGDPLNGRDIANLTIIPPTSKKVVDKHQVVAL